MPSLRSFVQATATWNPTKDRRAEIRYVDVSSVSSETLEIELPVPMSTKDAPSRARKIVQAGDTIFATIRPTLRRVAKVPPALNNEIASTAFCVLRPDTTLVDPDYLFFYTSSDSFIASVSEHETGASYPAVRDRDVLDQEVDFPNLDEQRQIAKVLNAIRKSLLIEFSLLRVAQKLKQATMRELFTRGLRGEAQKETEIGLVPESWAFVRLEDVYETQLGKMLSQKARGGDSPKPYLRNKNVQWGYLDLSDILEMDFDERETKKFLLKPGDLLVCEGGVIGRAAIWRGEIAECYYQKALHRIRPRNVSASNEFLAYWLSFSFEHQNIYGIGGASSTIAHLPQVLLDGLKIPQPSSDEQREIVTILNTIDQKINLHKQKRAVLEELFKSLLHKLVTGEIRVNELNLTELSSCEATE